MLSSSGSRVVAVVDNHYALPPLFPFRVHGAIQEVQDLDLARSRGTYTKTTSTTTLYCDVDSPPYIHTHTHVPPLRNSHACSSLRLHTHIDIHIDIYYTHSHTSIGSCIIVTWIEYARRGGGPKRERCLWRSIMPRSKGKILRSVLWCACACCRTTSPPASPPALGLPRYVPGVDVWGGCVVVIEHARRVMKVDGHWFLCVTKSDEALPG
jgi:hypothetical protein